MAEQSGDKTQDATPFRRQQAREKGQVAQSQDLASAVMLVAGVLVLMSLGSAVMQFMGVTMRDQLGGPAWLVADRDFMLLQWDHLLGGLAKVVLPILLVMMATAVAVQLAQIGFLFVPNRLMPDLQRISPWSGMKRIFSLTGTMRLSFGMLKVLLVGVVAYFALATKIEELVGLCALPIPALSIYLVDLTLWTTLKIGVALLILALMDYTYQRFKHEQDLKMTTQEVRDEMKNLQGDPQMMARRRQVQRQLVMNRLSESVPKAEVVVTNPTELAIAIAYDPTKMAAPIIVAKGAGVIAQRIRRLALENNIPIVEKKPLARALYQDVEVNHPIPDKLYAAVAEVLAYVYQLKGKEIPGSQAA